MRLIYSLYTIDLFMDCNLQQAHCSVNRLNSVMDYKMN